MLGAGRCVCCALACTSFLLVDMACLPCDVSGYLCAPIFHGHRDIEDAQRMMIYVMIASKCPRPWHCGL